MIVVNSRSKQFSQAVGCVIVFIVCALVICLLLVCAPHKSPWFHPPWSVSCALRTRSDADRTRRGSLCPVNLPVDVLCSPITEWSINHPFLSPLPFLLCLRSSGVWQRDAALSERRHVPPPSAVPLSPRLHGHPVRESSLPGPRGVWWPIVWTGLLQSSPHRPPARSYPRNAPAIDCLPLLRELNGLPSSTKTPSSHTLRLNSQP